MKISCVPNFGLDFENKMLIKQIINLLIEIKIYKQSK